MQEELGQLGRAEETERDDEPEQGPQDLMRRPAEKPRHEHARREVPFAPTGGYASGPPTFAALPAEDRELEHELEQLVGALRREVRLSRDELRDEVNARLWGPGRFRYVLRTAEEEGVLRPSGRDRYALDRA